MIVLTLLNPAFSIELSEISITFHLALPPSHTMISGVSGGITTALLEPALDIFILYTSRRSNHGKIMTVFVVSPDGAGQKCYFSGE